MLILPLVSSLVSVTVWQLFQSDYLFHYCWILSILCVFRIIILYQTRLLKILSPSLWLDKRFMCSSKDWCWSSNTLTTRCEVPTHWKGPWYWQRLRAGGEVGDRGWDGWMASPTQRTWIWANARREWRTEKPGVLQSIGSQRCWHNLVTEQQEQ